MAAGRLRGLPGPRPGPAGPPLELTVPYLNPDPPAGVPDGWRMPHLVGWSLATTRPFDALGPLLSFSPPSAGGPWESWSTAPWSWPPWPRPRSRTAGLRLAACPVLGAVLFRYAPAPDDPEVSDRLERGHPGCGCWPPARRWSAVQAVDGPSTPGLTLLDPTTTEAEVADLVALVAATGAALDHP